jgi:membrane protein DedA with SNARE-associated domain
VIATLASVAGGLLGYAIGYLVYESVGAQLLVLLGLAEGFPKAACYLREYGVEIIMIKGATPIPFKLLTITAGFIEMSLLTFIGASIVSRSISFMIVGVLFRIFGAPIKAFIDKYLGLATAGFVLLVVGGFVAVAMLSGGTQETNEKCEAVASLAG